MLDNSYYTLNNALNYQMFFGHCEEVKKGSLGHRTCHLIIAATQILPMISALFELLVVKVITSLNDAFYPQKELACKEEPTPMPIASPTLNIDSPTLLSKLSPYNWSPMTRRVALFAIVAIPLTYYVYTYFNLPLSNSEGTWEGLKRAAERTGLNWYDVECSTKFGDTVCQTSSNMPKKDLKIGLNMMVDGVKELS